jgi:hypothetical protein
MCGNDKCFGYLYHPPFISFQTTLEDLSSSNISIV